MSDMQRIRNQIQGDKLIVGFEDRKIIVPEAIDEMGREMASLTDVIEKHSIKTVSLDFQGVDFCASSALRQLIVFKKQLGDIGVPLLVRNLRPEIREVFRITRLDQTFGMEDEV